MKHCLILLFIILISSTLSGQKKTDIPDNDLIHGFIEQLPENLKLFNLQDLKTSTDFFNIRIWQPHTIFTLHQGDFVSSNYKIYTRNDEPTISSISFSEKLSKSILDSLKTLNLMKLRDDNYRGIDGSFTIIEISDESNYKVVSYWSPSAKRSEDNKTVVRLLQMIHEIIKSKEIENEFRNSLKPGGYTWGMVSFRIDKFLDEGISKTDFYLNAEEKIKTQLNITKNTNHWDYPIVYINGKRGIISELNQYKEKDIEKFEILAGDNALIYGFQAKNGAVVLQTK